MSQRRWYQHTAEPMRDSNGNIVQWHGLILDIDESKRAEDRLRQTQAELARATQIATVAELSASIAHELNQPLTSVIANAQACKRWLAASPPNLTEARVSVESVVRDARSADETMQSIRALFKRQSGYFSTLFRTGSRPRKTRDAYQRFALPRAALTTGPRCSRSSITVRVSLVATAYSTHSS
jgi:C4-dicarboxylate-specific signal transduction histidine kinase